MSLNTGLSEEDRKSVAEGLSRVLADTYTLYLKTQNFHWNVTGPQFGQLHSLFEEQYDELRVAADDVAERIRALGHFAPGSYVQFAELKSVAEAPATPPASDDMIRQLAGDNETLSRVARSVLTAAENAGDEVTIDMMVERMAAHEKAAWMLRAHIQ
ncbi:Dps family protein [Algihabitans albus]|uniref:Dps family protein n=1 Tax=Algihabitans albus TaxID=2164067 RepID=UPI000E5C845B|nr:Dps family protein [Algihabitans albus]